MPPRLNYPLSLVKPTFRAWGTSVAPLCNSTVTYCNGLPAVLSPTVPSMVDVDCAIDTRVKPCSSKKASPCKAYFFIKAVEVYHYETDRKLKKFRMRACIV